jgi:glycosyltransferase involved in cell wall biosynthesis
MRFRMEQWVPYLEQEGSCFTFVPFEDRALHEVLYRRGSYVRKTALMLRALWRRFALPAQVRDYDLVFLHREASLIGPPVIERLIAKEGVPIVYDFDDPIWMPYDSPSNGIFSLLKCLHKTSTVCRLASAVTVGYRLLASWAWRHNRRVHVVPSTVDLRRFPVRPIGGNDHPVTLGWTGSHSTLPFLQLLEKPLRCLAARYRFRLLIISHTATPQLDWAPVQVVGRKWRAATEAVDLHAIDIGLGPFPDSGWTPWRCHGKVLQYMAAGIPTVASRIGILPDYIQEGREGFLASTDEEWVEKLSRLIEDVELRRAMGRQARQTIKERYTAEAWAPQVRSILEDAAQQRRQPEREILWPV